MSRSASQRSVNLDLPGQAGDAMLIESEFCGPVFIVGLPRSGTKLLRGLLNRHSMIGIPEAETEFLPHWHRDWSRFGDLTDRAQFRDFYADVKDSAYFRYLKEERNHDRSWEEWHQRCANGSLPAVFEALIRIDTGMGDGGIWGDKSPGYIRHIDLIRHHFPQARIIHIVRDVRDYCLSIQKAWGKDPLRAAQRWVDAIEAIENQPLLRIRYEDLLEDPKTELSRVCDYLDIEFEESMLHLTQVTENLGDTRGKVGIQTQNRGKYLDVMAPKLRRRIESLSAPTLVRLGYPVEGHPTLRRLSPRRMALGQAYDGFQLVRSDVALRGWLGAIRFRWRIFQETGAVERLRAGKDS